MKTVYLARADRLDEVKQKDVKKWHTMLASLANERDIRWCSLETILDIENHTDFCLAKTPKELWSLVENALISGRYNQFLRYYLYRVRRSEMSVQYEFFTHENYHIWFLAIIQFKDFALFRELQATFSITFSAMFMQEVKDLKTPFLLALLPLINLDRFVHFYVEKLTLYLLQRFGPNYVDAQLEWLRRLRAWKKISHASWIVIIHAASDAVRARFL